MEKELDCKISPSKYILFTGAGFTKNFGGYLANEMWAQIHNKLQHAEWAKTLNGLQHKNYERLMKTTKKTFDYEKLFQKVVKGKGFNEEEKEAFNKCILDVYKDMDVNIRDSVSNDPILNFSITWIRKLLKRFDTEGRGKSTSFFFTLNQDIYIERQFIGMLPTLCVKTDAEIRNMGGKMPFINGFSTVKKEKALQEELKKLKMEHEQFRYVKLHGSFNWRDSYGNKMMVIGTNKEKDIKKEPILNWYKDLFEEVLSTEDCRILIIGYGFRDPHINKIILKSIKKNGLKIYIIYLPSTPEDFKNKILKNIKCNKDKEILWQAISGHYPYTFETLFPKNGDSREYYKLINEFFES